MPGLAGLEMLPQYRSPGFAKSCPSPPHVPMWVKPIPQGEWARVGQGDTFWGVGALRLSGCLCPSCPLLADNAALGWAPARRKRNRLPAPWEGAHSRREHIYRPEQLQEGEREGSSSWRRGASRPAGLPEASRWLGRHVDGR